MQAAPIRIAILDMYDGQPNMGRACIDGIVDKWALTNNLIIQKNDFEVRTQGLLPDTNFDIYIATGGPGSPTDTADEKWDKDFTNWLEKMLELDKHVFLICHSFQIACRHFNIGNVCLRKSRQIGILPVHVTHENHFIFDGMEDTFHALESRLYQIIEPNDEVIDKMNAKIIALEKNRPTIQLERAIMALEFSANMTGVQFHPEAETQELIHYFHREDIKESIIENFGIEKWNSIIDALVHPSLIKDTYAKMIPNFLNNAIKK
jgi:GMP synthase-like glutamine amidotransferase